MYYTQESVKQRTLSEFYPPRWKAGPVRTSSQTYQTSKRRVYSFRSSRPKNDSSTAVVPGESLVRKSAPGIRGIVSYLDSYKAAIQSLDDEAGQSSADSGYGAYDKGHAFSSLSARATVAVLHGKRWYHDSSTSQLSQPFSTAVQVCPVPAFYMPGEEGLLPPAVVNTVQELALATIPDKISGSLGQDLVDLAALPKLMTHLVTVGHEVANLRRTWEKLSVRVRHAIDICIRDRSRAPKWALRAAGSGYLEWLFVLSPYIDDVRLVMRSLSDVSSAVLRRYSSTRNRTALDELVDSQQNSGQGRYPGCWRSGVMDLDFDHTVRETYSVHLAIAWVRRGPLPSDDTFATKAAGLNRSLGVWYPSLLWDLMPWTWLVDWCSHIGDSIDGIYAVSNSSYRPAYAWATVRHTITYDGKFIAPDYKSTGDDLTVEPNHFHVSNSSLFRYSTKVNGAIMPQLTQLSGSQKSILAALGLSHIK